LIRPKPGRFRLQEWGLRGVAGNISEQPGVISIAKRTPQNKNLLHFKSVADIPKKQLGKQHISSYFYCSE
jgi:hypothetical protein